MGALHGSQRCPEAVDNQIVPRVDRTAKEQEMPATDTATAGFAISLERPLAKAMSAEAETTHECTQRTITLAAPETCGVQEKTDEG